MASIRHLAMHFLLRDAAASHAIIGMCPMNAIACLAGGEEYRRPPVEPVGYEGASCELIPRRSKVHMGTLGCSGSRVLWQGTKENTQTTDGLCCLPPSHEASAGTGLQNPLSNGNTEKPVTHSGGIFQRTSFTYD
ncbi:hypothetical protein INR49_027045 [Caranx melampygus]|nr:hypothetical protein INR49_027045 [Caranx melampygus]